jgi:hypothetical protein
MKAMSEDEMRSRLQKALSMIGEGHVFGDALASGVAGPSFEGRLEERLDMFAMAFTPVVAEAIPDIPEEIRRAFIHRTKFWVACLLTADERLTDDERLSAAALCVGLLSLGDIFLDGGDPEMETAVCLLLDEHGALPAVVLNAARPDRGGEQGVAIANLPASNSLNVQARLAALRKLAPQIAYLSRPDDACLLHTRCLDAFADSLATRKLSQQYLVDDADEFWERNAQAFVKHSILGVQVMAFVGPHYALYRHEGPNLPTLAEIMREPRLTRLVDHVVNGALRVFDDFGDRKADSGTTPWGPFMLNLFNSRHPLFADAFFRFAGFRGERQIAQAVEALRFNGHEGDGAIVRLFITLLREEMEALPVEVRQRYGEFIRLIKRYVDAGYALILGDPSFY